MSFEEWMRKVDQVIEGRIGLTSSDLPDWLYYDAFEDGYSPEEAASGALDCSAAF